MCAAEITVPAGNPESVTWKSTVPDWMTPAVSRVRLKVIVAVPVPADSALVTAGISFAALSWAVNLTVFAFVLDGDEGLLLPHAADTTHSATIKPVQCFTRVLLFDR